jgi:hypothetical protein
MNSIEAHRPTPDALTIDEVAEHMGCSRQTVPTWIWKKRVRVIASVRGHWSFIDRQSLPARLRIYPPPKRRDVSAFDFKPWVLARCVTDPATGCWLWTAYLDKNGYGRVPTRSCGHTMAYRLSYSAFVGPIPEGLTLDHLCRVHRCVNPAHLEPVTNSENTRRGFGQGMLNAKKTHCPNGHAYTAANTYVKPSEGRRRCKACRKIQRQAVFVRTGQ